MYSSRGMSLSDIGDIEIFPHGGDHERRRYIAQKLKLSARKGNTTLSGSRAVAHSALQELTKQKSA